jgi:hypothetical protein
MFVNYTLVFLLEDPLSSKLGNLNNVCVCVYYTFLVVSVVSMEGQVVRVCVHMYVCTFACVY